jgi:phage FluMu gp28-like protein
MTPHEREQLPAVMKLRPYQQRWVDDRSRFKAAAKCARSGFSFGSAAEAVLDSLEVPGSTWTCLSHGDRGSVEFLEEGVGKIKQLIQMTAQLYKEPYADEFGKTDVTAHRADFPNGLRIIALPSNPRTARGYPGNAILDEYGHHENSYAIWAAVSRQVALGHKLRALSTPNGEGGKYYDIAKMLGLTDGVAPAQNPIRLGAWSGHWVDVLMAIADGCPIDLPGLEDLYRGDPETMQQEFYCVFLKAVGAWLDIALISAAKDDGATMELPAGFKAAGFLSLGIDFGRSGDRSCAWLDEYLGDVSWARHIEWKFNMPFFAPDGKDQVHWLEPLVSMADRVAVDATGLGLPVYEYFNSKFPGKIMGVNFGGSVKRLSQGDESGKRGLVESVKIKTDMAVRMKRRMEQRLNRIPDDHDVVAELQAIKREQSEGGAIKFDAPRIELDTPSGGKKKVYSHAEAFWAKGMCDLAHEAGSNVAACAGRDDAPDQRERRRSAWDEEDRSRSSGDEMEAVLAGAPDNARRGFFGLRGFLR